MGKNIVALSAADKLALNAGLGMVRLSAMTITDPVEYIDVALPDGYDGLELCIRGLTLSPVDRLMFVFSPDGGTTFNFDPDTQVLYKFFSSRPNAGALTAVIHDDAMLGLVYTSIAYATGRVNIDPGSADSAAFVHAEMTVNTAGFGSSPAVQPELTTGGLMLTGKQNLMRILPWGGDDSVNPPTSGNTFIAGSVYLFGVSRP